MNAPSLLRLPTDLTQAEATVHSTRVGAVRVGNDLVREGRPASIGLGATHANALAPGRLDIEVPALADPVGNISVPV